MDDTYTGRAHQALEGFVDLIEGLRTEMKESEPAWLVRQLIERIGYLKEPEEERRLETPAFRQKFQLAVIEALKSWCGR